MKSAILLIVCGLLYSNQSFADTIYLKNNHRFEGIITKKTDEGVWMRGGIFYNSEIDRIEYNEKGIAEEEEAKKAKEEPLWDKFLVMVGAKKKALTSEEERRLRVYKKSIALKSMSYSYNKEKAYAAKNQRDVLIRARNIRVMKDKKSSNKQGVWKEKEHKWITEANDKAEKRKSQWWL